MTPIQVSICELPPGERKKHVLLTALWFGGKPNIDTFFQPFVEEMQDLSQNGFQWNDENGNGRRSRVFAMISPVDSIARPHMANIHQFNGLSGCHWCIQPGRMVPRGRGHARSYELQAPEPERRTMESWAQDAREAEQTGTTVNGIKGDSIISQIPQYDIVWGSPVEYLHQLCHGVVRQLLDCFLDSKHFQSAHYLGNRKEALDARLKQCKPPTELSRTPQPISKRQFWNASDHRHFLVYYAVFVFRDILPRQYYKHFCLLVYVSQKLLSEKIRRDELDELELSLKKVVLQIPELYGGAHACTFNVHQCTHIVECVRKWGPLWAHSAFNFESNNRFIGSMRLGTQHVVKQICSRYSIFRDLPNKIQQSLNETPFGEIDRIRDFFGELLGYAPRKRHRLVDGNVHIFASPSTLDPEDRFHQFIVTNFEDITEVSTVKRLVYGGTVINTAENSDGKRRQNNVVLLEDSRFFEIIHIFILRDAQDQETVYIAGHVLNPEPRSLFRDPELRIDSIRVQKVTRIDRIELVPILNFKQKCVAMFCEENIFVCPLIAHFESD